MKKIIYLGLVLVCISLFDILNGGYPFVYQGTVSATITSAQLRPRLVSRRKLVVENISQTYDVYLTTYPIAWANRLQGDRLVTNGGSWNDENYYLYISSWFVIADSGTITVQWKESE